MYVLKNRNTTCNFDDNGSLVSVSNGKVNVEFNGLGFDFGVDEEMALGLLEYESMLEFRTWNLPAITPTKKIFDLVPEKVSFENEKLSVCYKTAKADVCVTWFIGVAGLESNITITNTTDKTLYLNTCSFILRKKGNAIFDFPANAPIWHYNAQTLKELEAVQTGLINSAIHSYVSGGDLNLLFIDKTEKWGCGVYKDKSETVFVYDAGLEADLKPSDSIFIGSLYVDVSTHENPYIRMRNMIAALGYEATENGIHDGVMYSCHPSGTMDKKFPLKDDLYKYAEYLPKLKEMGIDHVWLLPVFYHDDGGVYHSIDQGVIDERYGGEDGCVYYCNKAHELGMTILFDYVPHGPAPDFDLVVNNPEWPSKRRNGFYQDEWECVSMDYNHPGYQEYTAELVHDHVNRFSVDGARIDCAMGGLSNWRPYG
ncbi:MAG: alpha-amylase family glycosyl hydrolase, partial [Clostridia bacterium]|nr:alpha-amylase family glycosyl hydrolase [Clostridia bacterium]